MENKRVLCCEPHTSIREISARLTNDFTGCTESTTVIVAEDVSIYGVIESFPKLVAEHAYSDSPMLVGELLTNLAQLYLMVSGRRHNSQSTNSDWIEVRHSASSHVAWIAREGALTSQLTKYMGPSLSAA